MNIHSIYRQIFKIWRQKRMKKFEGILKPTKDDRVLDVGGHPGTWISRPQKSGKISCLNVEKIEWTNSEFPEHEIETTVGDGCDLEVKDNEYEIVFSNSVIEHVGDWERQKAFAAEVMRVGERIWIQTPALECPIEPHFLAPFVHWFPVSIRRRILRWFTPWGWMTKPTQEKVDTTIAYTRLLSRKQVVELFPDCTIETERLFWIFRKSYIVYRS